MSTENEVSNSKDEKCWFHKLICTLWHDNYFWVLFWIYFFVIVSLSILAIPTIISGSGSWADAPALNNVGDAFNGLTGPFIAIGAAGLTFAAFWVQYQANRQQRRDITVERFENKYYELISLHKQNVDEIKIGKDPKIVERRKAFVSMFNEFKYTYHLVRNKYIELFNQGRVKETYTDERLISLAFFIFYSGVGPNSNMMNKAFNNAPHNKFNSLLFEKIIEHISRIKEFPSTERPHYLDNEGNLIKLNLKYKPWGGHQSRLGHYYRHLFQAVKYVAEFDSRLVSKDSKKEYLRTLRAQLSDHEQLMLYYNALAGFGKAWLDEGYFIEYKMIHNIPIPLANFGIAPQIKFSKELELDPKLFEWLE